VSGRGGGSWTVVLLAVAMGAATCNSEPDTPEARLRGALQRAEAAAEARDLAPLRELIAEDYQDALGHEKRDLVRFLAGLFLRHQHIHLLTRTSALEVTGERARATVMAAMAANAADLDSLRADLYRFDLRFAEVDGDWLLREAQWRPAQREDFF